MAFEKGKSRSKSVKRSGAHASLPTAATIRKPRRKHVTNPPSQPLPDLSKLSRNQTIDLYHTIQKRLAAVDTSAHFANEAARHAQRQILRAQLKLIGLHNYQTASRQGEKLSAGFDCSKWVLKQLQHLSFANCTVRLLDVGAIIQRFPNATSTASGQVALHVTAIDLHPENSELGSHVIQADLIHYASNQHLHGSFDVICLSLCVNFEGCPKRRGLMLKSAQTLLKTDAILFFTLPAACVQNSRYFDEDLLRQVLAACGMQQTKLHFTNKLMLCVARRTSSATTIAAHLHKRKVLRQGASRNNFWIAVVDDTDNSSHPAHHPSKRRVGALSNSNQRKRARRRAFRAQRVRTNSLAGETK